MQHKQTNCAMAQKLRVMKQTIQRYVIGLLL
jgi:hypothetical protein